MALVLADRVKETTTTTGTGTVTLLGASTGYQSFAAVGNGNTTYYCIAGQTGSEWEVGIGTYTSAGTTLARNTVLASSNAGSLVTFSAGTKDVFVTQPAKRAVYDSTGSTGGTDAVSTNTASTVVRRDASGNFSAGTITATLSGNASTATASTTQAKTDASTNIATTAYGKWLFATTSTSGTLDWNDATNTIPGVGTSLLLGSATNGPGGATYYHPFNIEYAGIAGTGNVTQMAIAYGNVGNEIYMRGRYSGSWTSWVRFITSANYNSYAPTLTGTGASGTWSINVTGSAGSATTATTATNLAGGSAGTIPYQSAAGTTVQLAAGTAGYFLQANGAAAPSWVTSPGAQAGGVIYENGKTISSNYTLTTNKNGLSVGPITISSGVSVTVPSGQRWVVL